MNSKFAKIGGIFIVFVALAALIGTTMTFAQDDAPDVPDAPPVLEAPSFGPNDAGGQQGQRGERGPKLFTPEEREAALADALGISVETLAAAKEEAQAALLEQAVVDGKITQAQADAILSGENARGYLRDIFDKEAVETAVADALGLTVEELQAARDDGKRLPEIAAEQGVELSAVQEAAQAVREAALQQAVEDGLLTQEQADQLQNRRGGGNGGPRRNGNGGGRFGGDNPQGQPPVAPNNNG